VRAVSSHRDEVMWGGGGVGRKLAAVALPVLSPFYLVGALWARRFTKSPVVQARSSCLDVCTVRPDLRRGRPTASCVLCDCVCV
jgi:hypothetical protein